MERQTSFLWRRAQSTEASCVRCARYNDSEEMFTRRSSYLCVLIVGFACVLHLMTLLRPVLEPFIWALFLVMSLQPLTAIFESLLLGLGRASCRLVRRCFCGTRANLQCLPTGDGLDEQSDSEDSVCFDNASMETSCVVLSRVVAVACTLSLVMSVIVGLGWMVFDSVLRMKTSFDIYEKGVWTAVETAQEVFTHICGRIPPKFLNEKELLSHVLSGAKAIVSDLLAGVVSHTGKIIAELVMLALYVIFWLCTPMPMTNGAGRIFRRYLRLKGAACLCYGLCVGLMLHNLGVDIPAVFGLMSFLFSFIPEVGALVAMVLPVPVILFDSRLEAPLATLIVASAGQLGLKFVFANIIEVMLVEHDTLMKMHPVVTLLAFCFFGFVWGPTGMLLSVPLMAYVKAVVLSDLVPEVYRDPILIVLEGDRGAPEFHRRHVAATAAAGGM